MPHNGPESLTRMPSKSDTVTTIQAVAPAPRPSLLLLLTCLVALAVPFQLRLISHLDPDAYSDLYSPWFGSRAALHHLDPYSAAVTTQIQRDMYGHLLAPGDLHDPEAFVYPPWISFPLAPFTLLSWPTVEFLFAILAPLALFATVWTWMHLCRLRFDRIPTIAIGLLILASWPAVWGCYQRQPSLFVMAAMAFAILLFRRGSDIAAGVLLSLASVKPQLVLLLGAWLFLIALRDRRWRFVAASFISLGALIGGASLAFPGSLPHWIHAAIAYTHAAGKVSLLTHLLGPRLGLAADLALLASLCVLLWKLRASSPQSPGFLHAVALILTVTACLIPGNVFLLFNNLLLIPGILLLLQPPSTSQPLQLFRTFAGIALLLAVLVTPVCATIGLFTGYRFDLVMPPFVLGYFLPIPVVAALLSLPRLPESTPKSFVEE